MLNWRDMLAVFKPRHVPATIRLMFPKAIPRFPQEHDEDRSVLTLHPADRPLGEAFTNPARLPKSTYPRPLELLVPDIISRERLIPAYHNWLPDPSDIALDGWLVAFFKFTNSRRKNTAINNAKRRLFPELLQSERIARRSAVTALSWAIGSHRMWLPPGFSLPKNSLSRLYSVDTSPREFSRFLKNVSCAPIHSDAIVTASLQKPPPSSANQFMNACLLAQRLLPQSDAVEFITELPGPRNGLDTFLDTQYLLSPILREVATSKAFKGLFGPLSSRAFLPTAFRYSLLDPSVVTRFSGELLQEWLRIADDELIVDWLHLATLQQFSGAWELAPPKRRIRLVTQAFHHLSGAGQIIHSRSSFTIGLGSTLQDLAFTELPSSSERQVFLTLAATHPGTLHELTTIARACCV